jgi:hypothetical protein
MQGVMPGGWAKLDQDQVSHVLFIYTYNQTTGGVKSLGQFETLSPCTVIQWRSEKRLRKGTFKT